MHTEKAFSINLGWAASRTGALSVEGLPVPLFHLVALGILNDAGYEKALVKIQSQIDAVYKK